MLGMPVLVCSDDNDVCDDIPVGFLLIDLFASSCLLRLLCLLINYRFVSCVNNL